MSTVWTIAELQNITVLLTTVNWRREKHMQPRILTYPYTEGSLNAGMSKQKNGKRNHAREKVLGENVKSWSVNTENLNLFPSSETMRHLVFK